MTSMSHSKRQDADRMRRQGVNRVDDDSLPAELYSPRTVRPSKADLREEIANAKAAITRSIRCACGHQASIPVTRSMQGRNFRCSKCGRKS